MQDIFDGQQDARGWRGPESGRNFGYYWAYWGEVNDEQQRRQAGGGGGGGGAGGIGGLVLFGAALWLLVLAIPLLPELAFLALVVYIASWISGAIVLTTERLIPKRPSEGFRSARWTVLKGLWWYVALTISIRLMIMAFQIATLHGGSAEMIGLRVHQVLASSTQGFSTLNDVAAFASTPSTEWAAVALTMLLVRGPGLLVFSRMLSFGFTAPKSRGFIGFLLGVAVAVLCVTLGLSLAEGIALAIRHHMQVVSFIGDERPSIVLVYSALLVLPYGLLGGFAGGALLHALTPLATAQRVGSYWQNYRTAVRAMLVYGFLTVGSVLLFRDADALLGWLVRAVFGSSPQDDAVNLAVPAGAWLALAVLQLPALLAATRQIARAGSGTFDGARGYLKACAVAAVTCLSVGVPVWTVALRSLPDVVTRLEAHVGSPVVSTAAPTRLSTATSSQPSAPARSDRRKRDRPTPRASTGGSADARHRPVPDRARTAEPDR
jgi:hypothetical protein